MLAPVLACGHTTPQPLKSFNLDWWSLRMSEDFYQLRLLGQWNLTRGAWETGQVDLLSMRSAVYLETWPAWGSMQSGVASELRMPVLPTVDSGSSYLPTPRVNDSKGIGAHGAGGLDLRTTLAMLGTPTARDWKDGPAQPNVPINGLLGRMVWELLPTPTTMQAGEGETVEAWEARRAKQKARGINGNGMGKPLSIAAQEIQRGDDTPQPSADGSIS